MREERPPCHPVRDQRRKAAPLQVRSTEIISVQTITKRCMCRQKWRSGERTIASSPLLANLNSKSTFLGPIDTTCVKRFSFGTTCRQLNVVILSFGIAGKSCLMKSEIGSIVPPARMTLRAESTTSLKRSAGLRSMYRNITLSPSSIERRIRPSSFASTNERRNDSTKWKAAMEACFAAVVLDDLPSSLSVWIMTQWYWPLTFLTCSFRFRFGESADFS